MFGFDFMENFNYPYVAQSIRDFWRRWHISLSSWFRDYLYIPLGGNRCSEKRNKFNLVIVFFLCGLWHGASWTFVLWGLYHGIFIVLEHGQTGRTLERMPRPLRHAYALVVVLVGWVFFRAPHFWVAVAYLCNMVGLRLGGVAPAPLASLINNQSTCALIAGLVLATPIWPWVRNWAAGKVEKFPGAWGIATQGLGAGAQLGVVLALLIISAAWLAGGTYNPFIYFRF
jgi:alginate O-acetyltransferase complex protein AlgI